eukprot:9944974-Karenia_brevis.AAC.1
MWSSSMLKVGLILCKHGLQVMALYSNVVAYVTLRGRVSFMGLIRAGVNQGCPASAALFLVAINPILIGLEQLM